MAGRAPLQGLLPGVACAPAHLPGVSESGTGRGRSTGRRRQSCPANVAAAASRGAQLPSRPDRRLSETINSSLGTQQSTPPSATRPHPYPPIGPALGASPRPINHPSVRYSQHVAAARPTSRAALLPTLPRLRRRSSPPPGECALPSLSAAVAPPTPLQTRDTLGQHNCITCSNPSQVGGPLMGLLVPVRLGAGRSGGRPSSLSPLSRQGLARRGTHLLRCYIRSARFRWCGNQAAFQPQLLAAPPSRSRLSSYPGLGWFRVC